MDDMISRARILSDLCGSDFVSDKEMKVLSAEFFADFGCHWTEVLN